MRLRPGVVAAGMLLAALPALAVAADAADGSVFDDENIVKAAIGRINAAGLHDAHVNIASFQRRMLLTGEVPNAAARADVKKAVSGIARVVSVDDELAVGPIIGITARTRDSWISSDVKLRLYREGGFGTDRIHVVTENGAVFLMGTVTRKEGATAADIASTTERVARVVLVFQYLD